MGEVAAAVAGQFVASEAVAAGHKSCEIKPNDQLAHVSLSMALQKNNQIEEAEAEAAKAKILGWGGKLI